MINDDVIALFEEEILYIDNGAMSCALDVSCMNCHHRIVCNQTNNDDVPQLLKFFPEQGI